MKEENCKKAECFYEIANRLKRYRLTHKYSDLPENLPKWGICLLFENGETAYGGDKITYVSFNRNDNNVEKRMSDHFVMGNVRGRRSSFRNHIACALIAKNKKQFGSDYQNLFDLWSGNAEKNRKVKEEKPNFIKIEQEYEKLVDEYLEGKFEFAVIPVDESPERTELLQRIITTLAQCKEIPISGDWLGNYSEGRMRKKIKEYGIWNIKNTNGDILTPTDLNEILKATKNYEV